MGPRSSGSVHSLSETEEDRQGVADGARIVSLSSLPNDLPTLSRGTEIARSIMTWETTRRLFSVDG